MTRRHLLLATCLASLPTSFVALAVHAQDGPPAPNRTYVLTRDGKTLGKEVVRSVKGENGTLVSAEISVTDTVGKFKGRHFVITTHTDLKGGMDLQKYDRITKIGRDRTDTRVFKYGAKWRVAIVRDGKAKPQDIEPETFALLDGMVFHLWHLLVQRTPEGGEVTYFLASKARAGKVTVTHHGEQDIAGTKLKGKKATVQGDGMDVHVYTDAEGKLLRVEADGIAATFQPAKPKGPAEPATPRAR